jgi:hypothetical protein
MRVFFSLVVAVVFASAAWASSIRVTSVEERARLSDRVVRGEVLSTKTVVPDGDVRRMITITTLRVHDRYKGQGAATVEIFQIGGKSGLWEAHVPEDARFEVGERAVLFLRCRDASKPDRCTLVGLKTGKLTQKSDDEVVEDTPQGAAVRKRLSSVVAEIKKAEAAR